MRSTFGRLGKHSNRSHHAVAEPPPLPSGASPAAAVSASASASASASSSAPGANTAVTTGQHSGQEADSPADAPPQQHQLQSALSTSAFSSSRESFADPRQQTQQNAQAQAQQQSSAAAASSHLYHSQPPAGAGLNVLNPPPLQNPAGVGSSPIFDGRHPQLQSSDFGDASAVNHSQNQRYSSIQQQQIYGHSSSSIDDIPGTAGSYHQSEATPPPAAAPPEKRSARKLIKGIFSGSKGSSSHESHHHSGRDSRDSSNNSGSSNNNNSGSSHGAAQPGSYDNTGGLARRPSKRVSNPPTIKTGVSQVSQLSPDREWGTPSSSSLRQSPLQDIGEGDKYRQYSEHPSNTRSPPQDSRIVPPINTIREVNSEVEIKSPYDEIAFQAPPHPPPNHQLQQAPLTQVLQQHPAAHVQVHASHDQQQQQQQPLHYDPKQPAFDQTHPHQPPPSQQYPYQQDPYQQAGDPRVVTGHLGSLQQQQLQHQLQQNPETISQLSHESPIPDLDQRSTHQQQLEQPSPAVHYSTTQIQDLSSAPQPPPIQHSVMAPPGGGSRRSQEPDKALPGAPPGYRQTTAAMIPPSPIPPQSGSQIPGYQGDRAPAYDSSSVGQGRNSPQPSGADSAEGEKAFKELLTKYKNVKRLYFDGKSQIEVLNVQVEQLQNAVANQRLSQSRTVLDDSEYATRFNRLNGAINNLSFNIRKDWRCLPQWLENYVSMDALKTGKQEMTAVGRAVVSRWLVEEVFNKCFHPGLDPNLSAQLKEVELSIRGNAYTMHSQEELDALTSKVVSWRMATLDGLQKRLNSPSMAENRAVFITKATTNLTACLYQFLNDPPPTGVEGSTSMIVELAVGIAANMPLESRDVSIAYPLPGEIVQPHLMEVEKGGLPDLGAGADSDDDADKDKNGKSRGDKGKIALPKEPGRVRFAGFVALEVRGRQVLIKAPVWTL